MSSIHAGMGNSASMLPTVQDFERSLSPMANVRPTVTSFAEVVRQMNAALLERLAKRSMCEPFLITSALTIPTPPGPAIGSITNTRTTPTATTTSCAITANDELLRALRAVEQENARFPHTLSRVFVKEVESLLKVHRSAPQQALGPSFGAAKAPSLPPAAQAFPAASRVDSSCSA